jgi:hypothetical protein
MIFCVKPRPEIRLWDCGISFRVYHISCFTLRKQSWWLSIIDGIELWMNQVLLIMSHLICNIWNKNQKKKVEKAKKNPTSVRKSQFEAFGEKKLRFLDEMKFSKSIFFLLFFELKAKALLLNEKTMQFLAFL